MSNITQEDYELQNTGERRHSSVVVGDMADSGVSKIALVEDNIDKPKSCWGTRHTLSFLGFLGFACVYAMRVNLSVAIVAMVKTEAKNNTNGSDELSVCLPSDDYDPSAGNEGVTFPAMSALLASWIPPSERSKLSTLVYAGVQFGTVITMPVSGWLCDTDFLGGWPSVFYVFGILGIVWGVAWFLLVFNHPEVHPRISEEEKAFIIQQCGAKTEKPLAIPWKSIVTSLPFWAVFVVHVGQNWGFYTLLTELPTYLKHIQHFDMKSNGLLSALPYLSMWVFSMVYSNVMDRLQNAGKISSIAVRRLSMAIGLYGPMIGLVLMCFVDCDQVLAMVVLCVSVGLNGAIYCGYMCSHQDLAPNFAGTLMGITNTAATIPGFVSPAVTGLLTNGNQTLRAWNTVFLISSAIYFVSNTFYLIFIRSDVQYWNTPKEEDKDDPKKRF